MRSIIPAVVCLLLVLAGCGGGASTRTPAISLAVLSISTSTPPARTAQYQNPVPILLSGGGSAESCPDPSVIRGQSGDDAWYVFCTNERFSDGAPVHLIPVSRSTDLVHWTYLGDVFTQMPPWVASDGWLWAPDIQYFNNRYFLYYAVSNTRQGGSAIFVATADTPLGPWTAYGTPVVEPCCAGYARATIDPAVVEDNGQRYVFFGSFDGGISARALSADGLHTTAASEVQITVADRYEAPYIVKRQGYFYLMISAGRCCEGPFSGYGVFAARAANVLGPYFDRNGDSLLDPRAGGTPVLAMNGNRWLGVGHNAVATDSAGQDWIVYHAVDALKPYFAGSWTRRPLMVDRLDWKEGWPAVRGGAGASDASVDSPIVDATAPGSVSYLSQDQPGGLIASLSDEFNGGQLSPMWTWVRPPSLSGYSVSNGAFHFNTESAEIYVGNHTASLLTEPTPSGDYLVETKLSINVPLTGRYNFAQGGLVIYGSDDNYIKLAVSSINDTRQIEFAKQAGSAVSPTQYGSAFLSAPADNTYLRLVKRSRPDGGETYTAYSSHDGVNWDRGATWTHLLGSGARISLVSMSLAGFTTDFDYVRVYTLAN